jgi:hypothetical protein
MFVLVWSLRRIFARLAVLAAPGSFCAVQNVRRRGVWVDIHPSALYVWVIFRQFPTFFHFAATLNRACGPRLSRLRGSFMILARSVL